MMEILHIYSTWEYFRGEMLHYLALCLIKAKRLLTYYKLWKGRSMKTLLKLVLYIYTVLQILALRLGRRKDYLNRLLILNWNKLTDIAIKNIHV